MSHALVLPSEFLLETLFYPSFILSLAESDMTCTSSTPCFLFRPGLTLPVFFLLYCFNGAVTFDFTFPSFQAPPLFAESFADHLENTIVPYR